MPKFEIITQSLVPTEYLVEAKTEKEALAKFYDGEYIEAKELMDYELDSNEQVIEVKHLV